MYFFLSMLDFSRKGIVCFLTQENINKIPTGVKLQFLWVETLETTVLNSSTKKKAHLVSELFKSQ